MLDRDVHVSRGSLEMVLSLAVFTPLPKKRKKVKSYNERIHHHHPPRSLSLSLPNIPPFDERGLLRGIVPSSGVRQKGEGTSSQSDVSIASSTLKKHHFSHFASKIGLL